MRVYISQWARDAAHRLDMRREAWISRKSTISFIAPELSSIRIDSSINHTNAINARYEEVLALVDDAMHDIQLLQKYLQSINQSKKIDGVVYPKAVFSAYRRRVGEELQYKQSLLSTLKEQLRYRRMFATDYANPKLKEIFGDVASEEISDLFRLYLLFIKKMKEAYGKGFGVMLTDDEQTFLDSVRDKTILHRMKMLEQ